MSYIEPLLSIALLLLACGLARARRCYKGPRPWLLLGGVAFLFLVSWPPLEWLAAQPLERRYPPLALADVDADAIVVLSGGLVPAGPGPPYPNAAQDTYVRTRYAAWLYHTWRQRPVVACGGRSERQAVAAVMQEVLVAYGVPAAAIRTEERSRDTHENAAFGARLLRQLGARRIVLVTDARHMPRAAACFRQEGLAVTAAPCDFDPRPHSLGQLVPNSDALQGNFYTLHECVGLLYYRLRGWI